jgi:hypothetical protein
MASISNGGQAANLFRKWLNQRVSRRLKNKIIFLAIHEKPKFVNLGEFLMNPN